MQNRKKEKDVTDKGSKWSDQIESNGNEIKEIKYIKQEEVKERKRCNRKEGINERKWSDGDEINGNKVKEIQLKYKRATRGEGKEEKK